MLGALAGAVLDPEELSLAVKFSTMIAGKKKKKLKKLLPGAGQVQQFTQMLQTLVEAAETSR